MQQAAVHHTADLYLLHKRCNVSDSCTVPDRRLRQRSLAHGGATHPTCWRTVRVMWGQPIARHPVYRAEQPGYNQHPYPS